MDNSVVKPPTYGWSSKNHLRWSRGRGHGFGMQLATRDTLYKRKIVDSTTCAICNSAPETVEHNIRFCPKGCDQKVLSGTQSSSSKALRAIGWKPPQQGRVKLNGDGYVVGNPCKARSGGVFRDHQSCWLLGYSRNLGQASNIVAEFWGLREGLISHGFSYLDIELWDAKICHNYREVNFCTDALAKVGGDSSDIFIPYNEPPTFINHIGF
ncbi:hypothetical protein M9H77_18357 [Catharanthus roseus]|uniref:Uncharacterized protein n=1 Tax=Catharanthus roseus TaxID=4058 RepID=A0ACC0B778_CATRO|nr:hypothetical protein M9H77_18357 [Catharanthus roseus]